MTTGPWLTIDGNEAAAIIAHRLSEVCAIYPITPASPMGESADVWSAAGRKIYGARFRILSRCKVRQVPPVLHVAARSLACQALSIFGDHSDVMAVRHTGYAMLCAGSVQELMDFATIAHAATLQGRLPLLHFFDGFRTAHEVMKIQAVDDSVLRALISATQVQAHRARALSPEHPVLRGSAQNPDVYFQGRERVNPFYSVFPGIVQTLMDRFAGLTGRAYKLFDYHGAADAERVIVIMGSGAEAVHEAADHLTAQGEYESLLRIHWVAALYGHVGLSLAVTGGIHSATDAMKALMAGADETHLCSVLLKEGPEFLGSLRADMIRWMGEHDYSSVKQRNGSVSRKHTIDPSAYDRANYVKVMDSHRTPGGVRAELDDVCVLASQAAAVCCFRRLPHRISIASINRPPCTARPCRFG